MLSRLNDENRKVLNRGIDGGRIYDADRSIQLPNPPEFQKVIVLAPQDRAVVDEAFLRGASAEEAMGILIVRCLSGWETGVPAPLIELKPRPSSKPKLGRARRRFTIEDLFSLDDKGLNEIQQRRLDETADLRPLVVERYNAYVAHAKQEFNTLKFAAVRDMFKPIRGGNCPDPSSIATPEDKYRVMRGAYYRAGYTHIKEDVLPYIQPTVFFGVDVIGGVHETLKELLAEIEKEINNKKTKSDTAGKLTDREAGFRIGGFVPRLQCGSDQVSFHAVGLAIDIDSIWNPQISTARAVAAFQRATGENMKTFFQPQSRANSVNLIYIRIRKISQKLKVWLEEWLPKLEQLQADLLKLGSNPKEKEKVVAINKELNQNPDLVALQHLIDEYKKETIAHWRYYGIMTIPEEVVEAFLRLGRSKNARWGGEYGSSKDLMHLELVGFSSLSKGKGPQPRQRHAVNGFDDLYRPNSNPIPINGPR